MHKQFLILFFLLALIQSNNADEALEEDENISTHNFIAHIILQGNDLLEQQKFDSAVLIYTLADSLATLQGDLNNSAVCNHNIGLSYYREGKYILSKKYFEEGIDLIKMTDDEIKTAHYQISLGILYKQLSVYDKSMDLIMKSILIAEDHKDFLLMGVAYSAIAGIQNTLGNYKKALDYYSLTVDIGKELNDSSLLAKAYNNIGNVYQGSGAYELAKKFYFKSIKNKNQILETISFAITYKNLGDVCLSINQLDSADYYYKKALKISHKTNHKNRITTSLIALADLNLQKRNYTFSLSYLDSISKNDIDLIGKNDLIDYYKLYKEVYEDTKQYEKAIEYSALYNDAKDDLYNSEKTKGLDELRFQYETEKKDQTINHLNEINTLKNIGIVVMIIGLVLISFLSFRLFRAYGRKKKDNDYIKLMSQEARHRTKNNLQLLSSILRLQSYQTQDEQKETVLSTEHRVQSIVLLNRHLEIDENKNLISLAEYIKSLAEGLIDAYTLNSQVQLDINLTNIHIPPHHAVHLGLITNELITNSLKYAFKDKSNPQISIECLALEDNQYQFIFQDNGIGLDFDWKSQSKSSFGIGLIKDLCEQLYGDIKIENRDGFYFQLIFSIQ